LDKFGNESLYVEMKASQLQVLENLDMYNQGIFEMASYQPEDSGLPLSVWFDEPGKDRMTTHNEPRVKIGMSSRNLIPVSVEVKPRILLKGSQLVKAEKELHGNDKREMFSFISRNHKLILKHWNKEITTKVLLNTLK
jgi:hypothetical protein